MDMGLLKAANSTPVVWVDVEQAPYPTSYNPVMALAQNHIFFLNVPDVPAGSADIYVIHYNYFQPQIQAFPTSSGSGTIPATHGQTASFFQAEGVQEVFAFIPDDGSATYVLNVETNTTQILAGPSTKDAGARYFASITALVQLDSQGDVSYLLVSPSDASANSAAEWNKVVSLANAAPPTSSSSTSSSAAAKPTGTARSSSNNNNASSSTAENGAIAVAAPRGLLGGLVGAAMLACAVVLF